VAFRFTRPRLSVRQNTISLDHYAEFFTLGGLAYNLTGQQSLGSKQEDIPGNFRGYVQHAYKANGVVFACMLARGLLFSEARFAYRRLVAGRPGSLFGTPDLALLEQPWPNGTTGDLLARMIQDVDLAGNAFVWRRARNRLRRLRPDWVTIVMGSRTDGNVDGDDLDAEVLGYLYHPGGRNSGKDPVPLLPQSVAHWAPIPDPLASYRGMPWLEPIIREVMGDHAAVDHKLAFFENGGTPNLVVTLDPNIQRESFERWVDIFQEQEQGIENAYKTLYLGAGATPTPIGANMRDADFRRVIASGETRICMAAGVPPIIVGTSSGLEASTYSNYGQARRRFADGTIRPLWRSAAAALAQLVTVPGGSELWYDDRDIPFLQDDRKDESEVQHNEAQAIRTLVDGGYTPESAVAAVVANDLQLLKHTGLFSVQLQPAGSSSGDDSGEPEPEPTGNGSGPPSAVPAPSTEPSD
jgi:phage portal protein BeeE